MIEQILARSRHAAFGWRVSDYSESAYTQCSPEEMLFYLRCHAFLEPAGHPLTEPHVSLCIKVTGQWHDDMVLTTEDRRAAILWHFLVRPQVAGEGWNRAAGERWR